MMIGRHFCALMMWETVVVPGSRNTRLAIGGTLLAGLLLTSPAAAQSGASQSPQDQAAALPSPAVSMTRPAGSDNRSPAHSPALAGAGVLAPDTRPVAFAYKSPDITCAACSSLASASDQLPVRLEWRPAPDWVEVYPTIHWKTADERWVRVDGWSGVEKFKADFERLGARVAAQRPLQSSRRLSPFYWFTKNYPGRIWSYPGDIYSHLKEDLANHGFSEAELRGLSPIQMQKLHSADHEGLVSPGRPPAEAAPISVEPREEALAYRALGNAWFREGNFGAALAEYNEALQLDPKNPDVNSSLAWFHAACREQQFRDGKKAVEFARQACESSRYTVWNQIGTLAAAHAEAGQFELAVTWARRCYELAPDDEKPGCEERLRLYESGRPLRTRSK